MATRLDGDQEQLDLPGGHWACTCGTWHPPTQTSCANGQQILVTGEIDG